MEQENVQKFFLDENFENFLRMSFFRPNHENEQ